MIIETTTGLFLLWGAVSSQFAAADVASIMASMRGTTPHAVAEALTLPERALLPQSVFPMTLEEYVRGYFKDEPILAEIARCESHFRHFNGDGVIRGDRNEKDVGLMQINELYHENRAKKLGFDIHTLEGNLGYAKWLYERYGTDPWLSSARCWSKLEKLAVAR